MRELAELEKMFTSIGLGSEEERQQYLRFTSNGTEEKKKQKSISICFGTNSQFLEEKKNAQLA